MSSFDWPLMRNNILREDIDAVINYLQSNGDVVLTQSKNVEAFEEEWSKWLGVKHSVYVNSGASANLVTLTALKELYTNGEIVVPPLTWVSDVASVLQNGFTPVFCDIDLHTLGMSDSEIISKITPRTRAVFLTHVLGYNALTPDLINELERRKIILIEDVCESHGAAFRGRKLGTYGWASNFSFYYAHHLSTIEGGMICTNDSDLYDTVRMMRSHGMVRESKDCKTRSIYLNNYPDLNPDFIFAYPAFNIRSTELNAIIGRSQLKRLDGNNKKRVENLDLFLNNLDSRRYFTEFNREGNSNYAFTLLLREPDMHLYWRVVNALKDNNIEYRRGMSGGGNQLRQPYLKHLKLNPKDYPNTDHVHFYGFYIGNYPTLEKDKILTLCDILNKL